jgi:hypothetical protein
MANAHHQSASSESSRVEGSGSATWWRSWTPARAGEVTDQGWSLRAVLMFCVPPWPQTVYNMVPVMIAALQGAVGSDGVQEGETWGCKRGWQADHRLMRVMEAAW